MIYFDSAATSLLKPQGVAEAAAEAIRTAGNAARGAHASSLAAAHTVYDVRKMLAALFHCPSPERVIFTMNSTEALNMTVYGILKPGDHVITTDLEHNSVLRPLYDLESRGVSLSVIPADRRGCIRYEAFEELIRPETKLIICTHASNLTGNVLDIAGIGSIARRHGILFAVDASQTAGTMEIDMGRMNIDILCFTGHKGLMGPQGTGGLCLNSGVEVRPLLRGGSGIHSFDRDQPAQYPEHLEAGTLNTHGIAGLGAALRFIRETGTAELFRREHELMTAFYEGIRALPGVTVYGDFSPQALGTRAAIVAINIGSLDSAYVSDVLFQEFDIATRPGAHCAPRMHEALGTERQGAVRFSFSPFNTMEEVRAGIEAVREIADG